MVVVRAINPYTTATINNNTNYFSLLPSPFSLLSSLPPPLPFILLSSSSPPFILSPPFYSLFALLSLYSPPPVLSSPSALLPLFFSPSPLSLLLLILFVGEGSRIFFFRTNLVNFFFSLFFLQTNKLPLTTSQPTN